MKNKEYHTVCTVPNSNRTVVERGNIDTTDINIHECSLFWLGTGTSIKSGGVSLGLSAKITNLFICLLLDNYNKRKGHK